MKDAIKQLCSSPLGVFALTADGRLFERVHDPRNFDGRNPNKFVWQEYALKELPGKLMQICLSPRGLFALTDEGRLFERVRDPNLANAVKWFEHENPLNGV